MTLTPPVQHDFPIFSHPFRFGIPGKVLTSQKHRLINPAFQNGMIPGLVSECLPLRFPNFSRCLTSGLSSRPLSLRAFASLREPIWSMAWLKPPTITFVHKPVQHRFDSKVPAHLKVPLSAVFQSLAVTLRPLLRSSLRSQMKVAQNAGWITNSDLNVGADSPNPLLQFPTKHHRPKPQPHDSTLHDFTIIPASVYHPSD